MQDFKANILGTDYNVRFGEKFPEHFADYADNSDALFNGHNREIFICVKKDKDLTNEGLDRRIKKSLRHELIHAFLYESGLSASSMYSNAVWAENEEMVDWFAIQCPKIFTLFSELDLL